MPKKSDICITEIIGFENRTHIKIPLYETKISAGFPSPAEDYVDKKLDLNEYLITNPAATFFVKVSGDSMVNAGIHSGDILIVDRSLTPTNNKIIVAFLDGEFTVKRIKIKNKNIYLIPENNQFRPLKISENMNFEVWGIVTYVIHTV